MAVDNSVLSYTGSAAFYGDSDEWYILCTGNGRLAVKSDASVDVFIVGGGAGGGHGQQSWLARGGGGGGGGYRTTKRGLRLSAGYYTDVTIGAGGNAGANGGQSSAFGYVANGGSTGGNGANGGAGGSGGSGGGTGAQIDSNAGNYYSSSPGGDGAYAFGEITWDGVGYGPGGGGGTGCTSNYIYAFYQTRNSGIHAPGGQTGGGSGGAGDAIGYGGGGGGGISGAGGKGYQGVVIVRSSRGGHPLTITEAVGSSISVQRTSSTESTTGTMQNGDLLYDGDVLKVVFSAAENYEILTQTVNGADFVSGNSFTVSGNTSIATTARPLASAVGATDANIGSTSTITIDSRSSVYFHSLQYSFYGLSGYITSSGNPSASEVRFQNTSVAFAIPESFYGQIPDKRNGPCTITCRTYEAYDSASYLGEPTSCTITASALEDACGPAVSGTVLDNNTNTIALTGDNHTLIRSKSSALCTISASARQYAALTGEKINGFDVDPNNQLVIAGDSLTGGNFVFSAIDSRGFSSSYTVTVPVVPYIKLTFNPVLFRPAPTSGEVSVTFSGNYYNGSFGTGSGALNNTLQIRYQYREKDSSAWSAWRHIQQSGNYIIGSSSFQSTRDIPLLCENGDTGGFDYQKAFVFKLEAYDGANGVTLSSVVYTATVEKGVPIFDWGSEDFNFNVPVKIRNTDIADIFYPIGSVYLSAASTLPSVISSMGTWMTVQTGIAGVYGWRRIAEEE